METPRLTRKVIDNRDPLSRRETGDKSSAQCPSRYRDSRMAREQELKLRMPGGRLAARDPRGEKLRVCYSCPTSITWQPS